MADINDIKYYPDRFYIRVNGCNMNGLFSPKDDFTLSLDQAVFIHEYYHYLTNITTFQGVRSFFAAFCDMMKIVVNLTNSGGLASFPIEKNTLPSCAYLTQYWRDEKEIFKEDDIDKRLAEETENAPSHRFEIKGIEKETGKPYSVVVDGKEIKGCREYLTIDIEGLQQTTNFHLSIGALDEFLSASIDEFIWENNLADNRQVFNKRYFYPYLTFDAILEYLGLNLGCRSKILIAYYALHSKNPAVAFYDMLQQVKKDGYDAIEQNPAEYMEKHFSIFVGYDCLINEIDKFIEEAKAQKRVLTAHLLAYYQDRFITATAFLKKDPLFFVCPFLIDNLNDERNRQDFWIGFIRIKTCFPEPLMIQGKDFITTRPSEYGADLTVLVLAIYEIMESLEKNQVAKRLDHYKNKYDFPDGVENFEDVSAFNDPPLTSYWHKALNELGLYQFYRDNVK